jgi:hypothetical protein
MANAPAPYRSLAEAEAALARVLHGSTAAYWTVAARYSATLAQVGR